MISLILSPKYGRSYLFFSCIFIWKYSLISKIFTGRENSRAFTQLSFVTMPSLAYRSTPAWKEYLAKKDSYDCQYLRMRLIEPLGFSPGAADAIITSGYQTLRSLQLIQDDTGATSFFKSLIDQHRGTGPPSPPGICPKDETEITDPEDDCPSDAIIENGYSQEDRIYTHLEPGRCIKKDFRFHRGLASAPDHNTTKKRVNVPRTTIGNGPPVYDRTSLRKTELLDDIPDVDSSEGSDMETERINTLRIDRIRLHKEARRLSQRVATLAPASQKVQ